MKQNRINAWDYIAYALSAVVYILPQYLLSSYLSAYYTDVALISAGAVGAVVLVMRVTDGISDLVMGRVIDRTNTRWGKARPWIFVGTIGLALTLLSIFHVPAGMSSGAKIAWLAVTYFLIMTVFGTVEGVASNTVMIYLTDDSQQRNKFGASNMAGVYIGGVVATAVTSILLTAWGYRQPAYDRTMWIYAVLIVVFGVFGFLRLRERVHPEKNDSAGAPLSAVVKSMFQNQYYVNAVLAGLLINLINGITTGMGVYFCRDVFGDAGLYTYVTVALLFPTLIGLPFAVVLAKRWGHHKTLCYGRIGYMAGLVIEATGLVAGNLPVYFAGVVLCGLCGATFAACFTARLANICDYAEYKFRLGATGTLMSATSFCNKIGLGLGAAITGLLLEFAKYNGAAAAAGIAQSAYTVRFERWSVALLPLILNGIVTLCLYRCNVDPEMETVRAGLKGTEEVGENA